MVLPLRIGTCQARAVRGPFRQEMQEEENVERRRTESRASGSGVDRRQTDGRSTNPSARRSGRHQESFLREQTSPHQPHFTAESEPAESYGPANTGRTGHRAGANNTSTALDRLDLTMANTSRMMTSLANFFGCIEKFSGDTKDLRASFMEWLTDIDRRWAGSAENTARY